MKFFQRQFPRLYTLLDLPAYEDGAMSIKTLVKRFLPALLFLLLLSSSFCLAQDEKSAASQNGAALVVGGKRLITFYDTVDGYTPDQRAERAAEVLREVATQTGFKTESIRAADGPFGTDILAGDRKVATITDADAKYVHGNPRMLANDFILKTKYAMMERKEQLTASALAVGLGICIGGFLALLIAVALICRITIFLCEKLQEIISRRETGIKIQDAELLSISSMIDMAVALVKFMQFAAIVLLFGAYVVLSLRLFPQTLPLSDAFIESVKIPIVMMGESILQYIPHLFVLAIIGALTYCGILLARFVFNALKDGSIRLADFDPDWAEPSYRLTKVLLLFFGLVCALPYLPGWDTPAFKQLGLLVGVLISFGSSSAIANMVAGVVLTYTNAFRLGDRIQVGEHTGDVVDKTLFVTKIKTPKGETVAIPNGSIISGTVTNYSLEAKSGRLILYSCVTIGYDTPWRKVEEALLDAAGRTENVLKDPAPFVLQKSLDDFYVSYELNVYTDKAHLIPSTYSKLHANIQDAFFSRSMEIMSPHITSLRDGNQAAIPAENLPAAYQTPVFQARVELNSK